MAAPIRPHLISGTIKGRLGDALSEVTITLTHESITPSLSVTSDSSGKYIISLGKLSSQWSKGDAITLVASKTAEGTITLPTTIQGRFGQTVDLNLAETSDLSYYPNPRDVYNLNFSLLTTYDGEKVTFSNPLPVSSSEIDLFNNPSTSWIITRGDSQPDSETITLNNGDIYKRTFTYTNDVMTARSKWVKQ